MLVQIPIPATGGYANLGDGIILICAFLLHPLCSVIAAGLGSMLADLLAGYIVFAPGTLVIKSGVALIAALLFNRLVKGQRASGTLAGLIIASVLAEIFMVLGYFIYEALVMGAGLGAAGAIIGNVGQGAVGVIIACAVTPALLRSDAFRRLMDRTKE